MRTVPVLLVGLSVVAVLAGCSSSPAPSTTATPISGWTLDCGMGAPEHAADPAWMQPCEARASHTDGQKQEVWLAANPTDPQNIVIGAKDLNPDASMKCVWNGLFVTHDGGKSWSDVVIGGPYASRAPTSPYYGYACNTDPMGAFTSDGTLHWVVELYNLAGQDGFGPVPPLPGGNGRGVVQPGWKLVLAQSNDGGSTFPESEAVTLEYGDGVGILNDYSRITVNPQTDTVLPVINTYYPGAGLNAVPNPAAGGVCSVLPFRGSANPVQVAPVQPTLVTAQGNPGGMNCVGIAADRHGHIVLLAQGSSQPLGQGRFGVYVATSGDDGQTFGDFQPAFDYASIPGQFAESAYRTGTNFEVAFDNTGGARDGTLYAITAEDSTNFGGGTSRPKEPGLDDADIYVRSSTDQGKTWSSAVKVNADRTISHQFEPNVVVAADGSVHAFWMDKSYDTANHTSVATGKACAGHCWIDVTHAVSTDGGRSWSTERVTSVSWDGELGKHQEGFPFIGDYTGIGTSGNNVWGAFPDASNGKTTVIAAIKVHNDSLPEHAGHAGHES